MINDVLIPTVGHEVEAMHVFIEDMYNVELH